jgi:hypothetical protein
MEEEYSTTITFDDNPQIIQIERKLTEEKANLWWSRDELREFKTGRTEAVDALFKDAVKKYQDSVYRNAMREMRREMSNYRRLPEAEKNNIRNDFIDAISRQAYKTDTDWEDFQNSEYFKEYERLRRRGGRKRSINRRKKRTKRRTKRRTRK